MAGLDSLVELYSNFNSAIQDDYGGKSLTGNGGATIDTGTKKFGAGSLYLPSASSSFVSITDDSDFDLGDLDFTIDLQVRFASLPSGGSFGLFGSWTGASNKGYELVITESGGNYTLYFYYTTNGSTNQSISKQITIAIDTFYHFAIQRDGEYLTLYQNGTILISKYIGNITIYNSTADFIIGAENLGSYLNGYIDEFRFSKNIARYESKSFVPPTSNQSPTSNDALLLHMDGSDESTTFTDSSITNTKTVTANGNAKLKTSEILSPVFGTAFGKFLSTGDYLKAPNSSDWTFGTSDFTIDFWCHILNGGGAGNTRIVETESYGVAGGLLITTQNTNPTKISIYDTAGSLIIQSDSTLSNNNWHHIALVRSGGTITLYINGTAQTTTYSTSINLSNNELAIASNLVGAETFIGYLDEFRVSKGLARWTTNFTVPSTAYTSDSNTQLLLHMDGSDQSTTFTDDGNTGHTMTVNGNAQLYVGYSITPKSGTAMGYFETTGDYLSISDDSDFAMSSNNFLFQTWFNASNITSVTCLFSQRTTINTNESLFTYIDINNAYVTCSIGGVYTSISASHPFSTKTWYHLSIWKISGIVYLAIDGYILAVKTIGTFTDSTAEFRIAQASENPAYRFNGYLDEFRIVNGDSIYTPTSFTPPTSEYSTGDIIAPSITDLDPFSGEQYVILEKNLKITYDENVIAQSGKYITIYDVGANVFEQIEATNAKVTIVDNVVTINPAGIFEYGTLYYVLIDAGAFEDSSGNPTSAVTNPAYWNFLTTPYTFGDAVIEIGGVDYTDKCDMKSIKIVTRDNFSNSASCNISINTNAIKMGMELIIRNTVTSEILFGGLIQEPQKVLLSPDFMVVKVYAEGYKQIFGRRTFVVNAQNDTAGNIVDGLFTDFIKVGSSTSEGLTEGNIDAGVTIENYVKPAETAMKIFNDMANASGFKWWVTNEKAFYFQASPTYTDNTSTKTLTPDKTDSTYINCADMPTFSEDSSQFKTRQFVIGKTLDGEVIVGSYNDSTAETEMASRYGSGVYGAVMTSKDINNETDADDMAETEVKSYVNPAKITFKTFDKINVLELINVDIPILGISDETYKITQVTKTILPSFKILSTIVAEKYVVATKQKRVWTDDFNEMLKSNNEDEAPKEIIYDEIVGGTSITTVAPDTRTLSMTVDTDKALHTHYSIVGTCASAATITVTIAIDTVTKKVFTWDEPAGNFSKTLSFPIRTITTSKSAASITAVTSTTATLTIAGTDLTFWAKST